jgi:HlyD family secretion protein
MTNAEMEIKQNLGLAPGARNKKLVIGGAVVLVLLLAALGSWAFRPKHPEMKQVQYRTEMSQLGDLTVTVSATGQLKPTHTIDVGSEVSGTIDQVLVNYNDRVKPGQVLCRINTEKLDAQVAQDKASLQTARAKVDDAKVTVKETEAEYKRMVAARERSKNQLISQHDVDTAKASYDRAVVAVTSAQASVMQAEANLKMDETNVSKAVIKSTVDGIVLARNVEPGQTIQASMSVTTMFELAEDLKKMKLQVNIDEADIGTVKEGQKVMFTVDTYPGRQFPGVITQLRYNATTSSNVVTYLAEISVENGEMLLRPGMTATATITVLSLKNALLVPNHALRFLPTTTQETAKKGLFSGGGGMMMPGMGGNQSQNSDASAALNMPRVWVNKNGVPTPINVTVGSTNGKLTEIKAGNLTPGTPLIVEAIKDTK